MKVRKYLPYALMISSLAALASCSTIKANADGTINEHLETLQVATGTVTRQGPIYTLTLNPCVEGLKIQTRKGKTGASITLPTTPGKRDGYSFVGWSPKFDGKMGTKADLIEEAAYVMGEDNVVLYAVWQKQEAGHHTQEEIDEYVRKITEESETNHVYFHYYRFDNQSAEYDDWDVWAWPYRPTEGQGTIFDFKGKKTTLADLSVTGHAVIDDFGGAVADIDLTKEYDGGTSDSGHKVGGTTVSFVDTKSGDGSYDSVIGIQVVKSSTRKNPKGKFWTNDGGDLHVDLTDPERVMTVDTKDGGKAWHIFALQDKVASYQGTVVNDLSDPFEDDDGSNITIGNSKYNDVWSQSPAAIQKTAPDFASNAGVGYQVQISSFADSDKDGFGDIYGITQKLDYLKDLGIKALWLTPVQKSDSYHGYDISDYYKVDTKFGSASSPNAKDGIVTEESAMKDYEDLIEEAGKRDIRIVMDLVLNHSSTGNNWFIKSAQLDENYRGYYQWGNHNSKSKYYDKKVTEENCWYPYGDHEYSYYAKFGSSMPELNYGYSATRNAVKEMTNFWIEKGVKGFRLDAVKHIFMTDEIDSKVSTSNDTIIYDDAGEKGDYSSNLSKNLHFYQDLNKSIKTKNADAFLVGENFDGHAFHVSPWYRAFDSMFDFYGYFNMTTAVSKAVNQYQGAGKYFNGWMRNDGPFTIGSDIKDNAGIYKGVANNYKWNLPSTLASYDRYRSNGKALNGMFTSNHDIARIINRIAGTQGDENGITEQGTLTNSNYTKLRKAADCAKAAEILMPGLTWIYYGDEIGMTGNFPAKDSAGKPFTSASDYADLYWRQPMKWTANPSPTKDDSMVTDYGITGSTIRVTLDSFNKSNTVQSVETQLANNNSELNNLKKVIAYKNANKSMITGTLSDAGSTERVLKFKNGNITVTVNLSNFSVSATGGNGSLNVTFA